MRVCQPDVLRESVFDELLVLDLVAAHVDDNGGLQNYLVSRFAYPRTIAGKKEHHLVASRKWIRFREV
jgi:hypothetical protein